MADASQQQDSVVAIGSWVWRVLGILLGTATCISLVKNGFAIELTGLPAAIFRQYAWLRDMLFEPVVWVLRYLGLTIPWWLKDLLAAYTLVAVAHWRTFRTRELGYLSYMDLALPRSAKGLREELEYRKTAPSAAMKESMREIERIVRELKEAEQISDMVKQRDRKRQLSKEFIASEEKVLLVYDEVEGRSRTTLQLIWAIFWVMFWPLFAVSVLLRLWRADDYRITGVGGEFLRSVRWNLAVIASCTIAFLLWNHLQNTFGPGG